MTSWQEFVLAHGRDVPARWLAHILAQPQASIRSLRGQCPARRSSGKATFPDLFALWHGRPPSDNEWPTPQKGPRSGDYEWQGPELALLASLVGRIGKREIAAVLTQRLRKLTSDDAARRTEEAVQCAMTRIGLTTYDVLGGITVADAARELSCSRTILDEAIRRRELQTLRCGRLLVIPHEDWAQWKRGRVLPPAGFVPLASIRVALGIRSDGKLSEYAKAGHIPTAVQAKIYGDPNAPAHQSAWYIEPSVAAKLVRDRRAGRPMPWHGKPYGSNILATWRLFQARQHPAECAECTSIWGPDGAPSSLEALIARYPALTRAQKRHITKPFLAGLGVMEVMRRSGRSHSFVHKAIAAGALKTVAHDRTHPRVSARTASNWIAAGCPLTAGRDAQWISIDEAIERFRFVRATLAERIGAGLMRTRCPRDREGQFTLYLALEDCQALKRRPRLPEPAVHASRRVRAHQGRGFNLAGAARDLRTTTAWVRARIDDGTIFVRRAPGAREIYIQPRMMDRLRAALAAPKVARRGRPHSATAWLRLSAASIHAGVSLATIGRWVEEGAVATRTTPQGWLYSRAHVSARAKRYWRQTRVKRLTPPPWIRAAS